MGCEARENCGCFVTPPMSVWGETELCKGLREGGWFAPVMYSTCISSDTHNYVEIIPATQPAIRHWILTPDHKGRRRPTPINLPSYKSWATIKTSYFTTIVLFILNK